MPWGSAHLTLVFDERGVEISGSHRGERSVLPWASVTRVSRGVSKTTPDGGSVTVIGIESPGRIMRFVVTSHRRNPIELAALSEQIQRWSDSAGSAAAAPTSPPVGHPVPAVSTPVPAAGNPARPEPAPAPPTESLGTEPAPVPRPDGIGPMLPVTPGDQYGRAAEKPRRRRRVAVLLVALAFLGSGTGLAIALATSGPSPPTAGPATARRTPDQALAQRLMLTRNDVPTGWRVSSGMARAGSSPRVHAGESMITQTFAKCMAISQSEASSALGGGAADQTAQTTSPVFLAPTSADRPGFALELQTAATIVRSHSDEQGDFALFADPRYPQCLGAAVAAETQLGADGSSGTIQQPGPVSVTAVNLAAPAGEQVVALLVDFSVSDRSASVPVEVETVSLGHARTEANLQALAIGGPIPADVLASPVSVFEQRVATGGQGTEI